ncbi:hypothetical protein AAG570_004688 [Ranatra chinensis]|uniref:Nucleoporin Nup120/160 beta-propeller domain-containing protein n=1 Tax=Ranatra chinensis TaxID=642074 RepID=A0ABD0Y1L4_9HEMI
MELVEDSLDVDLTGSQLRLRFSGSHVLEGVSIAETANSVVILVPTVSSVHRFMFPHPERLLKQGVKHPLSKSIFCDANEADASDPNSYHVLSSNPSEYFVVSIPDNLIRWGL